MKNTTTAINFTRSEIAAIWDSVECSLRIIERKPHNTLIIMDLQSVLEKLDKSCITKKNIAQRIWEAYPRKVGKLAAMRAINRALAKSGHHGEYLLDKVKEFAASPAGKKGSFTPHCSSWFNAGKYDDDPSEWHREGVAIDKSFELPEDL